MKRAAREARAAEIRAALETGMDPVEVCCTLLCGWESVERVLAEGGGMVAADRDPASEAPPVAAPPAAGPQKIRRACMSCGKPFYGNPGEVRCWRCDAPVHREVDAA